jgi:hypothetical protein
LSAFMIHEIELTKLRSGIEALPNSSSRNCVFERDHELSARTFIAPARSSNFCSTAVSRSWDRLRRLRKPCEGKITYRTHLYCYSDRALAEPGNLQGGTKRGHNLLKT